MTEHGNFAKYLNRFQIIQEEHSRSCNSPNSVDDAVPLFEYEKFEELRENLNSVINADNLNLTDLSKYKFSTRQQQKYRGTRIKYDMISQFQGRLHFEL